MVIEPGIHLGHPALSRRGLLLTKLLSGTIFRSQKILPFLTAKVAKMPGTVEGAGDCQNAAREGTKTKNASGKCPCQTFQVGAVLQAGVMVVVIFSLHLVVFSPVMLTCFVRWWEQLSLCSPSNNSSEKAKIPDLALIEGPSNALAAP